MSQRPTIVVQISRGLAPARSIAETACSAVKLGMRYELVEGRPAAEAKQRAVDLARESRRDLVLVEDDIVASMEIWHAVYGSAADTVAVAEALMRNGQPNVVRHADGRFIYSGTCFVRVPLPVLERLPAPVFQPREMRVQDGELVDHGAVKDGRGSDLWFWHQVRKAEVPVEVVGRVIHLSTPLNTGQHYRLDRPHTITPFEERPL